MKKLVYSAGLCLVLLIGSTAAQAVQGLNGAYYQFSTAGPVNGGPGTVAQALSDISTFGPPTATFIGNTICFPFCGGSYDDGGNLVGLLGGNASNISNGSVTPLNNHAIVLTGYIDLTTGENLSLGSDDGSALWINGGPLIDNDGDHGFGYVTETYGGSSGWQQIKILQFEDGGVTGLSVLANGNPLGGMAISTPEPSTWAMMLVGFAGLGFAGYRGSRRKAAVAG